MPPRTRRTDYAAVAARAGNLTPAAPADDAEPAKTAPRRARSVRRAKTEFVAPPADLSPVEKPLAPPRARRASTAKVRTLPYRISLDLQPAQYAELKRWCQQTGLDLGLPKVDLAPVLRVLAEELISDKALHKRVQTRLVTLAMEADQARATRRRR